MNPNTSPINDEILEQSLAATIETILFELAHGNREWKSCAASMIRKSIQKTNKSKFYDIEVRIAPALFRRFATIIGDNGACWKVHSSFGVVRDVTSPAHLASLLLPELEHQCQAQNIARHIRIDPKSNFICIASITLERRLQSLGLLPCPICQTWSNSHKSMWWHLQVQHSTAHHEATESATYHETRDSTAIVVYEPNQGHYAHELASNMDRPTHSNLATNTTPKIDSKTPWDAVKDGSLEVLQLLLSDTSFDVHRDRDRHGSLLIHWAAGGGYLPIMKYLVESLDCDACATQVGHRSFEGRTPLHWAARNGHLPVVEFLLSLPNIRTHIDDATADGTTAFCWAAWQGHQSIMERLWEAGCDVQTSNRFGCNASLWAAQGKSTAKTLEWLTKKGCSAFVVNKSKHGVMHKASQRGNKEICEWFADSLSIETFSWCLIGPDCDDAAPSDLAGMEGHRVLAKWLAELEMMLVVRFAPIMDPPTWLTPYSAQVGSNWEPGGGVLRMRSVYKQERNRLIQ